MEVRELTCIGCPLGCALTVTMEDGTKNPDKIEVTGIEAVYNNAPVGIEDVESDNIEKAELTIADGTISATSVAESIEIYNLAGQLISVAKDTQHIASPSAGSYIVKVTIDGKSSASKVIL